MPSSGDGVRSARSTLASGSSDPRLPTPPQTCTPQPAPCCVAEPKSLPTASVVVVASESGQHGRTAARHAHGALLRSGCVLPKRTFLAARPPSGTAHPVAHTSPETRASRLSLPRAVVHARAFPAAHGRGGAGPACACGRPDPSSQLHRRGLSMQCSAHCAALLASAIALPVPSSAAVCRHLTHTSILPPRPTYCLFRLDRLYWCVDAPAILRPSQVCALGCVNICGVAPVGTGRQASPGLVRTLRDQRPSQGEHAAFGPTAPPARRHARSWGGLCYRAGATSHSSSHGSLPGRRLALHS